MEPAELVSSETASLAVLEQTESSGMTSIAVIGSADVSEEAAADTVSSGGACAAHTHKDGGSHHRQYR